MRLGCTFQFAAVWGAWAWLLFIGCAKVERIPGAECELELRVHTPPYQDAFDGVSVLRLTMKIPGSEEVSIDVDVSETEIFLAGPPAHGATLVLEGLGIDGQEVISSGESAPFTLDPQQPAVVDLLFARRGEFAKLGGNLGYARFGHTATALPDGRMLLLGGAAGGDLEAPTGFLPPEVYDLKLQRSCVFEQSLCPFFSGADRRYGHTASLTPQGLVFVFGGQDEQGDLVQPILLFDPDRNEFRELTNYNPKLIAPRSHHSAEVFFFDDGSGRGLRSTILVAGGEVESSGRRVATSNGLLFDIQAGAFTRTDLTMIYPRRRHSLTAFGAERRMVLVAGGEGPEGFVEEAEVFDGTGFSLVEPSGTGARGGLYYPRVNHSAVAVPEGVVVLGGDNLLASMDAPEIFLPGTEIGAGFFTLNVGAVDAGHSPRSGCISCWLPSGEVLFAGGEYLDGFSRKLLNTVEVLRLGTGSLEASFHDLGSMGQKMSFPGFAKLTNGALVIAGGFKAGAGGPEALDEVWYYNP